jgi:predicted transcriptional regulator
MSSITINLSDEHLLRLKEIAARLGVAPEELARVSITELLAQPDEKFERASDYVLKKNIELYRRLA